MAYNAYYEIKLTAPQTIFPNVSWSFKSVGDVLEVYKNGILLTDTVDYTFNGTDTVTLVVAGILDDEIIMRRVTQIASLVDYLDGSALTEADLDLAKQQNLDLTAEAQDISEVNRFKLQAQVGDVDEVLDGTLQEQVEDLVAQDVVYGADIAALVVKDVDLQAQIDLLGDPILTAPLTVTGPNIGRLVTGDVLPTAKPLEDILRDMLQQDTPPTFSLAGSAPTLVERGTSITPTLTPSYVANDAGPSNDYKLFKNVGQIHTSVSATPFTEAAYIINVETATYHATLAHDAGVIIAGNLISNNVIYRGVHFGYSETGGDILVPKNNTQVGATSSGYTFPAIVGDNVSLTYVWCYLATLPDPSSVIFDNGVFTNNIVGSITTEAQIMVTDAGALNPVAYKVFSYSTALAGTPTTSYTLTIG